jgi:competence protein ComEC
MFLISLGFLLGVGSLQQCESLLPVSLAGLLIILVPLLIKLKTWRLPLAIACGFLWALFQAHDRLYPELEREWEGRDLVLSGVIASLPERRGQMIRFLFNVEGLKIGESWQHRFPTRVRLSWYGITPSLRAGQRWQLTARLKRPWSFKNPGGFDYEGWLFRQGIRATGYVRQPERAQLMADEGIYHPVDRLRQHVGEAIARALNADSNRGVLTALAIGDRHDISKQQWRVLLKSGTNHLLAISGLHIGLVAGVVYFLTLRIWRLRGKWCGRWPAQRVAALIALTAGCGYALLAGFSVPTQRAMIMLCVVMGAVWLDRDVYATHTLSVALLAVLLWDSMAVLSAGFWLSFGAVAVIKYAICGRPMMKPRWWHWGKLQWIVAIGLFPLTLLCFQRSALIAPLANLFAVPWVGMLVVPVVLAGSLLVLILPVGGNALFGLASHLMDPLWWLLEALGDFRYAQWFHDPPVWALLPATLGGALLLAPRGWPARWLGVVLISPMILVSSPKPGHGEYWFTLLDVGQGLAAVVETRQHTLVYDTGAKFSDDFNAGEAVVLPFLRSRNVGRVDLLLVSHGDNDHIGGAAAVIEGVTTMKVLTSVPDRIDHPHVNRCQAGQRWQWDGVDFEVLHPPLGWKESGNNQSCVLRVRNEGGSILVTADIGRKVERHLLENYGEKLSSDIMLIPHHASRTSSSVAFLTKVNPETALLTVGYRNRFGFPQPDIIARYKRLGIRVRDTLKEGAIRIRVHPVQGKDILLGYRQESRRYWSTSL